MPQTNSENAQKTTEKRNWRSGPKKGQGGRTPKITTVILRQITPLSENHQLEILDLVRKYIREEV